MIELCFPWIGVAVGRNEHGDPLHPSVLTLEQLILRFGRGKRNEKRVVFTNGCFHLLHPGHIKLLEAARALGDVLVVGLNSDRSMQQLKGLSSSFIPQAERAEILANLEAVDAVVIFDEPTPLNLISALLPDVLVKGADWRDKRVVGREEVEAAGGRVELIDVVLGYSTTEIVRKVRA